MAFLKRLPESSQYEANARISIKSRFICVLRSKYEDKTLEIECSLEHSVYGRDLRQKVTVLCPPCTNGKKPLFIARDGPRVPPGPSLPRPRARVKCPKTCRISSKTFSYQQRLIFMMDRVMSIVCQVFF